MRIRCSYRPFVHGALWGLRPLLGPEAACTVCHMDVPRPPVFTWPLRAATTPRLRVPLETGRDLPRRAISRGACRPRADPPRPRRLRSRGRRRPRLPRSASRCWCARARTVTSCRRSSVSRTAVSRCSTTATARSRSRSPRPSARRSPRRCSVCAARWPRRSPSRTTCRSRSGPHGRARCRDVGAGEWADLRGNYAAATAAGIDALMGVREPERGRLLLWHGVPGTGKTHALRALARAWRPWCSAHCILDPDALLSPDPRYLLDVLEWDDDDRWRLLVLEDAGALARFDAGRASGMTQLLEPHRRAARRERACAHADHDQRACGVAQPRAAPPRPLPRRGRVRAAELPPRRAAGSTARRLPGRIRFPSCSRSATASDAAAPNRPAFGFGRAILSEALKPDLERVI